MEEEVLGFIDENDGIATVAEMAELTGEDEGHLRRYARHNDLRRAGSTFIFTRETALDLLDDLEEESEEEEADDE